MQRDRTVRNLRLVTLAIVVVGGVFSLVTGTWRDGVLGLSISLAVAVFGVGERLRGADRAVGLALVIIGAVGVVGHLVEIAFFGR